VRATEIVVSGSPDREHEGKNGTVPRFVAHPHPAAMVLDGFPGNRKAEAAPVRFTVGGKRLEQPVGNFRRDTRSGVLHFGDDFPVVLLKAEKNSAALWHHVRGIVEQVEKNPAETAGVERKPDGRRFVLEFDADGFDLGIRV
jgi:hypothetical protein